MWHIYILRSIKDQKLYIGCTNNLKRRIGEHNHGFNTSTRSRTPFELVYKEMYSNRAEAFAREKQIKSYKGGEAFKKLLAKSSRRWQSGQLH